MEKLILKDGTELEIKDGASVNSIELEVADYSSLETLAFKLTKENLSEIKFQSGDQVTGEYSGILAGAAFPSNAEAWPFIRDDRNPGNDCGRTAAGGCYNGDLLLVR